MKTPRLRRKALIPLVALCLAPAIALAAVAAPDCFDRIVGMQTGATGDLMGQVEVTQTVSTDWIGKIFSAEADLTIKYNVGTYLMSNGYTYTVDCGTGKVLNAVPTNA